LQINKISLNAWQKEKGIDKAEWDGVVETCDICEKVFVGEVFKAHYRGCWTV
jgi:hypothetical protein